MYTITPQRRTILKNAGLMTSFYTLFRGDVSFISPCFIGYATLVGTCQMSAYNCVGNNSFVTNFYMGSYSTMGNTVIAGLGKHETDNFLTRGEFKRIYDENTLETKTRSFTGVFTFIKIGHDVQIKDNVILNKDLTVGDGALIEKGAIITKDIPPYAIVNGTNRIVGQRFSDEIISDLLEIQWWKYNIPKMQKQGIDVPMQNPKDLIQFFKDQDPSTLIPITPLAYKVMLKNNFLASEVVSYPV